MRYLLFALVVVVDGWGANMRSLIFALAFVVGGLLLLIAGGRDEISHVCFCCCFC